MKILVLGGSGFVGRNVMDALATARLTGVSACRTQGTDLKVPEAVKELMRREQPNVIINCAAHVGSLNYVTAQSASVVVDNTRMILSMYEALAVECPQALVINPIANCAYPDTVKTFEEDRWWDGPLHRSVLSFGTTRRLLWSVAECFQMQYGIRSVHFLVPNMYGPYESTDPNKAHALNALVSKFVKAQAANQQEVVIWGSGMAIREWLYAPDFARVALEVVKNPTMIGLSEPLNIAQNFGLAIRELVALIAESLQYTGKIRYDCTMPDGAPRKVMDDQRFRKSFPDFQFTPLRDGILSTVAYYRSVLPY